MENILGSTRPLARRKRRLISLVVGNGIVALAEYVEAHGRLPLLWGFRVEEMDNFPYAKAEIQRDCEDAQIFTVLALATRAAEEMRHD